MPCCTATGTAARPTIDDHRQPERAGQPGAQLRGEGQSAAQVRQDGGWLLGSGRSHRAAHRHSVLVAGVARQVRLLALAFRFARS